MTSRIDTSTPPAPPDREQPDLRHRIAAGHDGRVARRIRVAAGRRTIAICLVALMPGIAAAANSAVVNDVTRSIHRMRAACEPARVTFACSGWTLPKRAQQVADAGCVASAQSTSSGHDAPRRPATAERRADDTRPAAPTATPVGGSDVSHATASSGCAAPGSRTP
jgi:hypothetical protein